MHHTNPCLINSGDTEPEARILIGGGDHIAYKIKILLMKCAQIKHYGQCNDARAGGEEGWGDIVLDGGQEWAGLNAGMHKNQAVASRQNNCSHITYHPSHSGSLELH